MHAGGDDQRADARRHLGDLHRAHLDDPSGVRAVRADHPGTDQAAEQVRRPAGGRGRRPAAEPQVSSPPKGWSPPRAPGILPTTWRRSHSSSPSAPARKVSAHGSTCTAEPIATTWSSGQHQRAGVLARVEPAPDGAAPPAEGTRLAVRPGPGPAEQADRDEPTVALLERDVVDVADHLLLATEDLVVEQAQPQRQRGARLDRPAAVRCRGS